MNVTRVLRYAANDRRFKSLALSVYFKHPALGMTEYEILSRATAYLLSVDAKDKIETIGDGPYAHLEAAEERREYREYKQASGRTHAGGAGRKVMDVSWLEFVPREVRPRVHIVCSSHVLAPYLWKDYYPQEWLSVVRQEHCKFSLEVYDPKQPEHALANISLNSQPYHHPEGRDIALIHFKDELQSLETLEKLGVQTHYLRDTEKLYNKGEVMTFDGYVVDEPDAIDGVTFQTDSGDNNEDARRFFPYKETGVLAFHTEDRFFATTPKPLPQGLCGAPVSDQDGDLCGTVEGIVPLDFSNQKLAGSAAFLPSFVMKVFIDFVERSLVEQMMPDDLFQMIVTAKKTNSIGGGLFRKDKDGTYTAATSWEEEYERAMVNLRKKYTKEEMNNIMDVLQEQRDDVLQKFDKEGGDLDQIIERIRLKGAHLKAFVHDQYNKTKKDESAHPSDESTGDVIG